MKPVSLMVIIYFFLMHSFVIYAFEPFYTEDFEDGNPLMFGWTFEGGTANWSLDSSQSVSGDSSLCLTLPSGVSTHEQTYAYGPLIYNVPSGQYIRVCGYIKTENVTLSDFRYRGLIRILGINMVEEYMGEGAVSTDGFVYHEKIIFVPEQTSNIRLDLYGYGPAGKIWFDDVKMSVFHRTNANGLYTYWPLDGDLIDNGINKIPLEMSGGYYEIVNAHKNEGYFFDNINNGPQAFISESISIDSIDEITTTAWIRPTVLQNGVSETSPHTILRLYNTANQNQMNFCVRDGKLCVYYGGSSTEYLTDLFVPINTWSFVAVVQSGTTLDIYLNSSRQTFSVNGGLEYNSIAIGNFSSCSLRGINGSIDEICIYKTALTDEDILNLSTVNMADINRDGYVNYADLSLMLNDWLESNNLAD